MANIRESARAFVPKQTKNIADLDRVNLNWPVEDRTGKDDKNKEFSYKVVVKDDEEYRIPGSVLNAIKTILEVNPTQEWIKVVKKGTGMNTEYTVIQIS